MTGGNISVSGLALGPSKENLLARIVVGAPPPP
jgi:hypothetical protein